MGSCVRRNDAEVFRKSHTATPAKGFKRPKIYSLKPSPETFRNSGQRRRGHIVNGQASLLPLSAGGFPPVTSIIGRRSMSKRIALFSAAAFGALALTATVVAPVSAQDKMKSEMSGDKTVMVGGAAMFPSKNIIQNAVNSKDHTTLVAAVKAAGLVDTLEGKGPFTVFAPTNAAFGKLPPARSIIW
jgi:hypothetical protein